MMEQHFLTPAAGKRLIARVLVERHPRLRRTLAAGTLVVVAGTTNSYVAEELRARLAADVAFDRATFMRGVTRAPGAPAPANPPAPLDIVIEQGVWRQDATIFDVAPALGPDDLILKGVNALDLEKRQAAVYIGHPHIGTLGAVLAASGGRRVPVLCPVGVEKRAGGDLLARAARLNAPGATGPRLLPLPGEVFTELDAFRLGAGVEADLVAAGGVDGAEGGAWFAVEGEREALDAAAALVAAVRREPPFATMPS